TVVVVLLGRSSRPSSTPAPAWVSSASVVSGVISLIELTRVVLPTPKPPVTRIFSETVVEGARGSYGEVDETDTQFLQESTVVGRGHGCLQRSECTRSAQGDVSPVEEIGQEDGDRAQRDAQACPQFGRGDGPVADPHDVGLLQGQFRGVGPFGDHEREGVRTQGGPAPAADDHVEAVGDVRVHHVDTVPLPCRLGVASCSGRRSTSRPISVATTPRSAAGRDRSASTARAEPAPAPITRRWWGSRSTATVLTGSLTPNTVLTWPPVARSPQAEAANPSASSRPKVLSAERTRPSVNNRSTWRTPGTSPSLSMSQVRSVNIRCPHVSLQEGPAGCARATG